MKIWINKLYYLICTIIILSGCNSGSSSENIASLDNHDVPTISENVQGELFIDALGMLPAGGNGSYTLMVNNPSQNNYTLDTVQILESNTTKDSSANLKIVSQLCSKLISRTSCSLELIPLKGQTTDIILKLRFLDENNIAHNLSQIIRIYAKHSEGDGFIAIDNLDNIVTKDGNYAITIPLLLTKDFTEIKGYNGSLNCYGNNYKAGTRCNYRVSGKSLAESTMVSLSLKGYKNGNLIAERSNNITVTKNNKQAHLIVSYGIEIANKQTKTITLFNNGNTAATNITASITSDILRVKDYKTCARPLIPGNACQVIVELNANYPISGILPLNISYNNDEKMVDISTGISYKSDATGIDFSVTSFNLKNLVNGKIKQTFTLRNNSPYTLAEAWIDLQQNDSSSLQVYLENEMNCVYYMAPGKQCTISIVYNPKKIEQGSTALIVNGLFIDSANNLISQVNNQIPINYSAIDQVSLISLSHISNLEIIADGSNTNQVTTTLTKTIEGFDTTIKDILFTQQLDSLRLDNECKGKILTDIANNCKIKINFGPLPYTYQASNVQLKIHSETKNIELQYDILSNPFSMQSISYKGIIKSMLEVEPSTSGNGSNEKPYLSTSLSKGLTLKYTFENVGNTPIDNFMLNVALPFGARLANNSCSGTIIKSLLPGTNCSIEIEAPSKTIFTIDAHQDAVTNTTQGTITIPPIQYSYIQNNIFEKNYITDPLSVYFNRSWPVEITEIIESMK